MTEDETDTIRGDLLALIKYRILPNFLALGPGRMACALSVSLLPIAQPSLSEPSTLASAAVETATSSKIPTSNED